MHSTNDDVSLLPLFSTAAITLLFMAYAFVQSQLW
jgi:hypothetical protein